MDHDNWFTQHFLVHTPPARPLLLLLDGHSTHYHPGFITKAAREQVIVFCLPPNTTHLLQPLDKGAFGPLKVYWHQACQEFMRANPGQVITEYAFMKVFSKAWYRAMTIPNAMSAFSTTGIYPFCPTKVSATDTTDKCKKLLEAAGLPFLPVLSPAHPSRRPINRTQQFNQTDQDSSFSDLSQVHSPSPEIPDNLLLGSRQPRESIIKIFFPSVPITRKPLPYAKTCAKVLTSSEYLKELQEKQELKQQKEEEKEIRKQERDQKKLKKETEKELKKIKKGAMIRREKKVQKDVNEGN